MHTRAHNRVIGYGVSHGYSLVIKHIFFSNNQTIPGFLILKICYIYSYAKSGCRVDLDELGKNCTVLLFLKSCPIEKKI